MSEVPFGYGILSQGEMITSPEQHRLVAKRAWLQIWDFLMLNDEQIKATRLPVPWPLEEDHDILLKRQEAARNLSRFDSIEAYKKYVVSDDESHYDKGYVQRSLDVDISSNPRYVWMKNQVVAENPLRVLDVGSGCGNLAVALGRAGYQVTAMMPNPIAVQAISEVSKEENIAVEAIDAMIEDVDFGESKFDAVVIGEVIEHVSNDVAVLQKCCALAEKCVIVTTPLGSVEQGFRPNAAWRSESEHVRAYSKNGFSALLRRLTGVKIGPIEEVYSITGLRGQEVRCLCCKLTKIKEVPDGNQQHPVVNATGETHANAVGG